MSRTLSGNTTGQAARIERADFLDSIAPLEPLTSAESAEILKGIKANLEQSANAYPQFATGLLESAARVQLEIDNLCVDVPSGWLGDSSELTIEQDVEENLGHRFIVSGGEVLELD